MSHGDPSHLTEGGNVRPTTTTNAALPISNLLLDFSIKIFCRALNVVRTEVCSVCILLLKLFFSLIFLIFFPLSSSLFTIYIQSHAPNVSLDALSYSPGVLLSLLWRHGGPALSSAHDSLQKNDGRQSLKKWGLGHYDVQQDFCGWTDVPYTSIGSCSRSDQ